MSDKQGFIKTLIVFAAIIIASFVLAAAINKGSRYIGDAIGNGLSYIGSSVYSTGEKQSFDDFMSDYEAAAFLKVNIDDFYVFAESGELNGTFSTIQGQRVFSKEKLTQWFNDRVEPHLDIPR
jgi:hypothetical protein